MDITSELMDALEKEIEQQITTKPGGIFIQAVPGADRIQVQGTINLRQLAERLSEVANDHWGEI